MPEPIRSLAEVTAMLDKSTAHYGGWGSAKHCEDKANCECCAALATLAACDVVLRDLSMKATTRKHQATLDALLAPARGEGEGG